METFLFGKRAAGYCNNDGCYHTSSQTSENSPSSSLPGAAAGVTIPLTGVLGLIACLVVML
jgi:hypothetical protein